MEGKIHEFDRLYMFQPMVLRNVELHQLGELLCEADFCVAAHEQWCHEASYISRGRGHFIINQSRIDVEAGDVVLTPKGSVHTIAADCGEPLQFAYIGFEFRRCPEEGYQTIREVFARQSGLKAKDPGDIENIFMRCLCEFYRREGICWDILVNSWIDSILATVCRDFQAVGEPAAYIPELAPQSQADEAVSAIMRYIDRHVFDLMHVTQVGESLGYSKYYLSHLYKEKTGMTMQQYLARKKMHQAMELLKNPAYTVDSVSEKLSYSDVSAFSRTFKRVVGVSPLQYRKGQRAV